MTRNRDKQGRFIPSWEEPAQGPYEIECTPFLGVLIGCGVVDLRRPNPDPDNEGGKGFARVFEGSFAECDAWLETNP